MVKIYKKMNGKHEKIYKIALFKQKDMFKSDKKRQNNYTY